MNWYFRYHSRQFASDGEKLLLRAGYCEARRKRYREGGKAKTERAAVAQKGEKDEEKGQNGEGVLNRKNELFRARQRSLANRAVVECRAVLLLHER